MRININNYQFILFPRSYWDYYIFPFHLEVTYLKINGQELRLKEEHDFTWLEQYDNVFAVFNEQDSGNISFGVQIDDQKKRL